MNHNGSQFKKIPNQPAKMIWPKGAVPKEEYEENQRKMYNMYMPDAIESQKEYEAEHAAELKALEEK